MSNVACMSKMNFSHDKWRNIHTNNIHFWCFTDDLSEDSNVGKAAKHTHSIDVLDFHIYDATAGHSHTPHMKGKEQVKALVCSQNHTQTETVSEFPFMIFKKTGSMSLFPRGQQGVSFFKHTQRQTHGAGMVVNSGRIMGRVFLERCDWCLQGDRTDGGMGASAAQLTLSVWGLRMCAASYTRETPCDFPEACGRRPFACVCLCLLSCLLGFILTSLFPTVNE